MTDAGRKTGAGGPFGAVRPARYRMLWWAAVPYLALIALPAYFLARRDAPVSGAVWPWAISIVLIVLGLLWLRLWLRARAQKRAVRRLRPGASVLICAPSLDLENGLRAGGYLSGKVPPSLLATLDANALELWPRLAAASEPFARIPLADIAGVRADRVSVDASRYGAGANVYDWRAIVVVLRTGGTVPLALYRPLGIGVASAADANAQIAEFTARVPLLA
jgi:hypothetical protein